MIETMSIDEVRVLAMVVVVLALAFFLYMLLWRPPR